MPATVTVEDENRLGALTSREGDVLQLVAGGLTNRQVARGLDISEKTVKNHLSAIFSKIGAADRTQAALYALQRGMVPQQGGGSSVSPRLAPAGPAADADEPAQAAGRPAAAALTSREEDVLRLVVGGLTNRQVARGLDISEKTVKNHLSAIFSKIGAADRTQAAVYAIRAGIDSADVG